MNMSMPKVRAATSVIWNHFDISNIAERKAICRYCKNTFSYKSTITNLKFHLKKKHINIYREYCRSRFKNKSKNRGNVKIEILPDGFDGSEEMDSDGGNQFILDERTDIAARIVKRCMLSSPSPDTVAEFVTVPSTSCTSNLQVRTPKQQDRSLSSCGDINMPRGREATAHIWNYFDVSSLAEKKAICRYCKNTFSYKSTITNLKLHLIKKHAGVYEQYKSNSTNSGYVKKELLHDGVMGDNIDEGEFDGGNRFLLDERTGIATRVDNGCVTTTPPSVTVTEFVAVPSTFTPSVQIRAQKQEERRITRRVGISKKAEIDKYLLKLITTDLQPISLVENEGFREFTRSLNPSYELPSRKTISNRILPTVYETQLQLTKQMIDEFCKSICLTADCWTSRNLIEYVAITGHFIHTETLEFKSILLKCSALEDSHTASSIAEELAEIADEWNITEKINVFITNSATNMITAAHLLDWNHYVCYVDMVNSIVQEALNLRNIATIVQKVQKTVAHFKKSSQAKQKLFDYQTNVQNISPEYTRGLLLSIPSKWNSIYLMLKRFLDMQEALRATIPNLHDGLPVIPMEDWTCLEQLVEVLKPFHDVALIMCAEKYLQASKAIIITQGLSAIFERLIDKDYFTSIKDFVKCVADGVAATFTQLERNEAIGLCTYLDPRFKEHAFRDRDALLTLKSVLIDKIVDLNDIKMEITKENADIETFSIWEDFDRKLMSAQAPKSLKTKALDEVEMYLREPVILRTACPWQWWRDHKHIYPSLFSLFVKYCNVIITSVPCDREFSKAGDIITDRRSRLTSSKVTQIMFLNANRFVIE